MRFILLALICLFPLKNGHASEIRELYLSDEPLLQTDQNSIVSGVFADFFKQVAKEANRSIEIKRMPWKRAQKNAENGSGIALGPLTRTPRRENKYTWVAPLFRMRVVYLTNAESEIHIESPEHARQMKVGIKRATASAYAAKLHKLPIANTHITDQQEQLVKLLEFGRIDAWLVWDVIGYRAHKLYGKGLTLKQGYSEDLGMLYLAASKDISADEIKLWNDSFKTVIERGDLTRLIDKYTNQPGITENSIHYYQ